MSPRRRRPVRRNEGDVALRRNEGDVALQRGVRCPLLEGARPNPGAVALDLGEVAPIQGDVAYLAQIQGDVASAPETNKYPRGKRDDEEEEEDRGSEGIHHPLSTAEQMQTLTLDDGNPVNGDLSNSKSYSNYRSAMTTLSSSAAEHPLIPPPSIATTPAVSDPLLFPAHTPSPDSPSYADVIYSPFHDSVPESNGNGEISNEVTISSPGSQSSSSEYLKISVSNPQKEVESSNSIVPGGNTYITYLITTSTDLLDYGGSDFSVRRRFKDVVTLSDRLSEVYRGIFIPPRPDKSVVESQVMQKQEFVEQRRVELEKGECHCPTSIDVASRMLDGAVRLPKQLLGESRSVVEPQDVLHPAKGGRDMLRFFKELKQSVVNDWGNSRPPVEEDDKGFLKKKEKLWELEQHLTNASKQAESLVKAQQDMGETMGELGLAFIKLTKFENEQAVLNTQRVRAADMKTVAMAAVKASRLYRELNAQTVKHFDTLHEHMGLMLAVHNAFSDRSSALLTVQTLISELSSLHSRAEKLETASSKIFGGDKTRIRKLEDLKDAIRVTEDAKSCAIREYERIKGNVYCYLVSVLWDAKLFDLLSEYSAVLALHDITCPVGIFPRLETTRIISLGQIDFCGFKSLYALVFKTLRTTKNTILACEVL
ncbi:Sorting nexin 2B [Sesamum angolense]|uniref:Sorting nexin 2B n=2 Tax=Sesamum TaxID=4181 RepID=A0AAE1X9H6_9LAMI|nr:Sorting nexin 2B [Sesamum angolense]